MRKPVKYEAADVTAIQLLERGECPPELQKRALKWIINDVCVTYNQSYIPKDPDGTAFNEGARFCGNTIIKMLKLIPEKVARSGK
ncbi:MAG TPA: hypothetical protein VMW64_03415 [Dehalococcoidia bacterium]|nr:hypothetical protein [Dehalococcoidia bacterium]